MDSITEDYPVSRVPKDQRSSLINVTIVRVGAATALSQFMLGATLGHSMTFYDALLATALGSLILEFVSLGLGIAGQKEGLSTSLLARWSGFGRTGSSLIGLVIGVALLGWFGVQNSVFAEGLDSAFGGKLGFTTAAVITGGSITAIVAFGFRGLSYTAKLAVPLFFAIVAWSTYKVLGDYPIASLLTAVPNGEPMAITTAAAAIAGGFIAGALITPDMSRYCRSKKDVLWMTLATILIGEFIVNTIAIFIANAMDTADVVTILSRTSGFIGLATVIFSTIKINDLNLYSSALGVANSIHAITRKPVNRAALTIVMGVLGTVLSIIGILDKFVPFLLLLGVLFPPIAGVMLMDYFVVKSGHVVLEQTRQQGCLPETSEEIGVAALVSCVIGSLAGTYIAAGISSLNALIVAALAYWVIAKVTGRGKNEEAKK